jgi:hypothetical protein
MTRFSSSRAIMYSAPPAAEEAGTVEAEQSTTNHATADD